jgi:uncharacterized protein YjiS (DUF1127 family)
MLTLRHITKGKGKTMTVHAQTSALRTVLRPPRLGEMLAVWAQRRALYRLDDAALEDLGLTREAALREASRPFWDLPRRMHC